MMQNWQKLLSRIALMLCLATALHCGKKQESASRPSDDNPTLPGYLWDETYATSDQEAELEVDVITIAIPAGTFGNAKVILFQLPLPPELKHLKPLITPFAIQAKDASSGAQVNAEKDMVVVIVVPGVISEKNVFCRVERITYKDSVISSGMVL